jgi:hypothetical protein
VLLARVAMVLINVKILVRGLTLSKEAAEERL